MRTIYFEMTASGELVPFDPPLQWGKDESDEDYFVRLGFKKRSEHDLGDPRQIGERLVWHVRENDNGEGHQYLASWEDVNRSWLIWVPDWPALVKLQALFAPIIQAAALSHFLHHVGELLEKAFYVWHGHQSAGDCRQCDPIAYDARMRAKAAKAP